MSVQSVELVNVTPRKRGRPPANDPAYTPEIAEEICDLLAEGTPLAEICRLPGMPCWRTVYNWSGKDEELNAAIARAREFGYDTIAARLRPTARGLTLEMGGESTGDVQRDKLIIETDLKLLAKWSPRYAEKRALELTGGISIAQVQTVDTQQLTIEQQEALRQVCLLALSNQATVIEGASTSEVADDLC